LAYRGALSADRTFLIAGLACGSASAAWLLINRGLFAVKLQQVLPDLHQKWSLVKWLLASQLLWISAMGLYPWLIAAFQGVRANGIWAACQSVIMIGNLVAIAAQNLLGPKLIHVLARGGVTEMRAMIFKSVLLMGLIMSLLCIVCFLFGNSLVVLFFGHGYDGYGLVVSVLAVNLAVSSMNFPFSRGLFALERADMDFLINVAVVLSLLPGVWLVRDFGVAGAAFGLLAANALSVLLRGIAFNRISLAVTAPTTA
jgi:O-antigen/teichoic acid export membrane protein